MLADDSISASYCNPLTRTIHTASILASFHKISIIHPDGLRVIHPGRWEGMRRADVESQFPDEYAACEEDPFTFAPQCGEGAKQSLQSLSSLMRKILESRNSPKLLIQYAFHEPFLPA